LPNKLLSHSQLANVNVDLPATPAVATRQPGRSHPHYQRIQDCQDCDVDSDTGDVGLGGPASASAPAPGHVHWLRTIDRLVRLEL
jgi:hypothetical protein